jgi:hypothetical protein
LAKRATCISTVTAVAKVAGHKGAVNQSNMPWLQCCVRKLLQLAPAQAQPYVHLVGEPLEEALRRAAAAR